MSRFDYLLSTKIALLLLAPDTAGEKARVHPGIQYAGDDMPHRLPRLTATVADFNFVGIALGTLIECHGRRWTLMQMRTSSADDFIHLDFVEVPHG